MQVQVLRDGVGTAGCACASIQLFSLTRSRPSAPEPDHWRVLARKV